MLYVLVGVGLGSIVVGWLLPSDSVAAQLMDLVPLLVVVTGGLVLLLGGKAPATPADKEARAVTCPVEGRWLALNSPASKVPSHGVRAYGQAYAIDLCHEPEGGTRPAFGGWRGMRPPQQYPAFGQPVRAMVDGVVVAASDRQRDHRSRSSWWAVVYLLLEGAVREGGGPGFIVGNHVTVQTHDGAYALVAHLQRGSVRVRPGDEVRAGDVVGACGNSGNSSEPHVHAQLMDRSSLWTAQGLPMTFAGVRVTGRESVDGLPENGQHLYA